MKRIVFTVAACLMLASTGYAAERLLFDFGDIESYSPTASPDASGHHWNNQQAYTNGAWLESDYNSYGEIMGIGGTGVDANGASLPNLRVGTDNIYKCGVNAWGVPCSGGVVSSALYPATAQFDYIFLDPLYNHNTSYPDQGMSPGYVIFSGLDQPMYDITLFGSRATGSNRTAHYMINGVTQDLNAAANTSTTITFHNVPRGTVTHVNGWYETLTYSNAIMLEMSIDAGQYGYLGVADFVAVPEPATLGLLILGGLAALRRRR